MNQITTELTNTIYTQMISALNNLDYNGFAILFDAYKQLSPASI